jgi:hypothetical protein
MRVGLFKASQSLKKFVVDHRDVLPNLSKI